MPTDEKAPPRKSSLPLSSWADSQMGMLRLVASLGGGGGFIAWVLQESTGGHLLPWKWFAAVPAAMLLGAGAAGVGVYVLAKTDLKQVGNALFFALLCGVFFDPVWRAGSDFIGGTVAQAKASSAAAETATAADQLDKSVNSASKEQVKAEVTTTTDAATNLLRQAARVPDESLRRDLQRKSARAVDSIALAAPKAPAASIENLERIGLEAKQTGQSNVTVRVLDSLHRIEMSTTDPQIQRQAQEAARVLRRPIPGP